MLSEIPQEFEERLILHRSNHFIEVVTPEIAVDVQARVNTTVS
jgi:hypothetical protein